MSYGDTLLRNQGVGVRGALGVSNMTTDQTVGEKAKGTLMGAGMGAAGYALNETLAAREAARMAPVRQAYKDWMNANRDALNRNARYNLRGPTATTPASPAALVAQPPPTVARGALGLRGTVAAGAQGLVEGVTKAARGLPMAYLSAGATEGAVNGLRTPTEQYAERYGMQAGESLPKDIGIRSLGVMEDVGRALLMQPRRK